MVALVARFSLALRVRMMRPPRSAGGEATRGALGKASAWRGRMNFASDNAAGIAPQILAAISRANAGAALAYGDDAWTRRVQKRFAEIFVHDVAVFLVPTGTAANALALAHLTPPWGAVLCHHEAHIATDECGAPEFFGSGIKLVGRAASCQPVGAVAVASDRSRHHLPAGRNPRARRDRSRARARAAPRRRAHRQRNRAHERLAGASNLDGGRRRAVVRGHQGRRACR